jgi:hypothetical protein
LHCPAWQGLLAFAHFFMGQQHLAALRFGAARDSLAAAKASSGHDLPRVLGFRFHSFEKTIAKAEKAQDPHSTP